MEMNIMKIVTLLCKGIVVVIALWGILLTVAVVLDIRQHPVPMRRATIFYSNGLPYVVEGKAAPRPFTHVGRKLKKPEMK